MKQVLISNMLLSKTHCVATQTTFHKPEYKIEQN